MSHSYTTECEDGVLSSDSPLSNDGDNFGGSCIGGVLLKKGPWTSSEDAILVEYVKNHGEGNWNAVQRHSSLARCGKSCRLRWANHLRPNLKKGAFTQEEERIIIELHAKLGNKWARMAAHLPGRTDNEIKNYWNTRIKRRHRAGLPLYPPDLCLHAPPENQQQLSSPTVYSGDKGCHDIWQTNGYGTPDITFDSSNILPFTTESPGLPARFLMGNGFSSPQSYSFVPQTMGVPKRALEPDEPMSDYQEDAFNEAPSFDRTHTDSCAKTMYHSFGLYYPHASDHTQKLSPSGFDQDSPFMSSVIFSASERFTCAQKSELPSLQYHETGLDVWDPAPESLDSLVSSPLSGPLPSHCPSPGCSGLLDDLVYESKVLGKSENPSSNWATPSNISNRDIPESSTLKMCNTEFIGCIEHGSSIFNRYTRTGTMGRSLGEDTTLHRVKSEVFDPIWNPDDESKVNSSRPGAILGSYWVEQSACHPKQQGSTSDAVTALLEDDLGTDLKKASSFATTQPFISCSWNNMPPVCQMSDIP